MSLQVTRELLRNRLFGRNNGAANIGSEEVIEIVHLDSLSSGIISTMINTFRVLSHLLDLV